MAFEHKENSGSLFTNSKKEKDSQPDYTGTINIDGTLYQISAWNNEAKSGKKYFGLKVTLPLKREERQGSQEMNAKDLPF
jgi:uncharacterized protein (DUF736 family)|tara:strand:- start:8894 stop:9133 length:240 start_codon:yes stop_codon:yes gene_type:complete